MDLFHTLSRLEENDDLHIGRLLVLLEAFCGRTATKGVRGLTKLAKLDFLLRYPAYLDRALQAKGVQTQAVGIRQHERESVESSMVRFRYGPWDYRYRRFINLMVAKGLADVIPGGKTVDITLTPAGIETARKLADNKAFDDIARRAKVLKAHFDYQGTYLARFVYQTFPEIATLRLGEEIAQ